MHTIDPTDQIAMTLSEIAYSDPKYITRQLAYPKYATHGGWQLAWLGLTAGNLMYVAFNGKIWAVVIRGSETDPLTRAFWIDWFEQDLTALHQVPLPFGDQAGAMISWGTKQGFDDLLSMRDAFTGKSLVEFLRDVQLVETNLWVTGHSLGGCLASVMAPYLYETLCKPKKRPPSCILPVTFAAPTAGNGAFASWFDRLFPNGRRWWNSLDAIPHAWSLDGIDWILNSFQGGPKLWEDPALYSLVDGTWWILYEGSYDYVHPNGDGRRLDGKITDRWLWALEAGDQHSGEGYLHLLDAPEIIFPYPPSAPPVSEERRAALARLRAEARARR